MMKNIVHMGLMFFYIYNYIRFLEENHLYQKLHFQYQLNHKEKV